MRSIALMGRARSGKDTVARYLTEHHGYKRVAFADPLKETALKANPWITDPDTGDRFRLAFLVAAFGWEHVKDNYPEARRFLQDLGTAVRDVMGRDTWLNRGLVTAGTHQLAGDPVVFTDVRYLNEATALRHAGYLMVRIERPGATSAAGSHASETELDDYPADVVLINDGSVSDLLKQIEGRVRQ